MLQCSRSFTITACSCSKPGTSSQVGVVHSLYMLVATVSTSIVSVLFTPTMQCKRLHGCMHMPFIGHGL